MSGATCHCPCGLAMADRPQWSPLAMSGATFICIMPSCTCSVAAMEPARDERGDDGKGMVHAIDVDKPQWSPLAMSGATRVLGGQLGRVVGAAMEPARDERGDHVCDDRHHWLPLPQWSPLPMSGATWSPRRWVSTWRMPRWRPLAMSGSTPR